MLLLVVIAMSQYLRAELIEKAPRFICSFISPLWEPAVINCCTPMDLDGDGRVNDILFSCFGSLNYADLDYTYAEILRRNETWCKKRWNYSFDDNRTFSALSLFKPLDPC
jgi:hypothetical protein